MTKVEYNAKYGNMKVNDYRKMTKAKLIEVIADFKNGLENGKQSYIAPWGDDWTWEDEVTLWYERVFEVKTNYQESRHLYVTSSTLMTRKKAWLVNYVLTLDLAYSGMNEVRYTHRYH